MFYIIHNEHTRTVCCFHSSNLRTWRKLPFHFSILNCFLSSV